MLPLNPIQGTTTTNTTTTIPYGLNPVDVLRNQIHLEMLWLSNTIDQNPGSDPLSIAIKEWGEIVREESRNRINDLHSTVQIFREQLHRLLRDSFVGPLDRDALLGTDGCTYGREFLLAHLRSIAINEGENGPFYVQPHRLAIAMIGWLDQPRVLLSCHELNRRSALIISEVRLPIHPSLRQNRTNRQQRNNQLDQANALLLQNLTLNRNNFRDEIRGTLNNIRNDVAQNMVQGARRINALAQRIGEGNATAENALNGLNDQNVLQIPVRNNQPLEQEVAQIANQLDQQRIEGNNAFQAVANNANNNLAEITGRAAAHRQIENGGNENINNQIVMLAENVAVLEQDNAILNRRIERLGELVAEQEQRVRPDRLTERTLEGNELQQDLTTLLDMLNQLPDPVVEQIAPLRRRIAQDFVDNQQNVANVEAETRTQLTELRNEILNTSFNRVSNQVQALEEANVRLQNQATHLTSTTQAAARSQVELEININKVEKIIKEQKKAKINGMIKSVAISLACAAITGGVGYLIQEYAVELAGAELALSAGSNEASLSLSVIF